MALPKAGVQLVAEGLREYTRDLEKGNAALAAAGQGATTAVRATDALTKALSLTAAAQAKASDQVARNNAQIAGLSDRLSTQRQELALLNKVLADTISKHGEDSTQADRVRLSIAKLTDGITDNQRKVDTLAGANVRLSDDIERLGATAAATASELDATTRAAQSANKSVDGLAGAVSGVNSRGSQSVGALGQAAQSASAGFDALKAIATGALLGIGIAAVNAAAQLTQSIGSAINSAISDAGKFEAGMNEFGAVAGDSLAAVGLEVSDFRQQFIALGRELPVSTADVQQAAIQLIKGGIDPATIAAGGLRANLEFAAAGGLELAQAAEISAKTVGGWSDVNWTAAQRAEFLAHSTNLMAQAANASTVDVDELVLGLYNAQAAAKSAGISFDETTTTLALVSARFASSSEAGNAFKNFIQRLQPTTKPATEAMQQLGLYTEETGSAFYNAEGNFIGVAAASDLLQQATANLTNEQRSSLLQTIFQSEALPIAAALAEGGAAAYDAMAASISSTSNVQELAAQKQQGYDASLQNLDGSFEALRITIGSGIIPVLTELINSAIIPAVNAATTFADAVFGNQDALASLSPPAQAAAQVIRDIGGALGSFASQFATSVLPSLLTAAGDALVMLVNIGRQAYSYGAGIVEQLSAGMMAALSSVVAVLSEIGAVISYWLEPHSPPKIAPDLDRWGTEAAQTYLDGWLDADAGALTELGHSIQTVVEGFSAADYKGVDALSGSIDSVIKSLSSLGQFDERGIVPTLIGSRGALTDAIAELRRTGDVSEETFQRVISAAGPAGDTVDGYIRAYFDLEKATNEVAKAQDALNGITEQYAATLDPLNAQLQAVRDQRQTLRQNEQIAKAEETLASDKATAAEKEQAALDIQEIQVQRQIDAVERERDTAVDAAQQRLDAAKQAQAAQQQVVNAQLAAVEATNSQNALIAQQIGLLERLAQEQAAAAKAGGGGGGGGFGGGGGGIKLPELDVGSGITESLSQITQPLDQVNTALDQTRQRFDAFKLGVVESVQQASAAVAPLGAAVAGPLAAVGQWFGTLASEVGARLPDALAIGERAWAAYQPTLAALGALWTNNLAPALGALVNFVGDLIPVALDALIAYWNGALLPAFEAGSAIVSGVVIPALGILIDVLSAGLQTATQAIALLWQNVLQPVFQTVATIVSTVVMPVLTALANVFGAVLGLAVRDLVSDYNTQFLPALQAVQTFVATNVMPGLQALAGVIGQAVQPAVEFVTARVREFQTGFEGLSGAVSGVVTWLSNLASHINSLPALPDVFTPGSPTPAELGFLGIAEAVAEASSGFDEAGSTIGSALDNIGSLTTDTMALIERQTLDTLLLIQQDYIVSYEAIYSAVQGQLDKIVSWTQLAMQAVRNAVQSSTAGTAGAARNVGEAIGDGIAQGINAKIPAIQRAAESAARKALSAAKDELGIASPSKIMAQQVGEPAAQGVAEGILAGIPAAVAAAQLLGEETKDGTLRALESLQGDLEKLIDDSLAGLAGFTRARGGLQMDVQDLMPDGKEADSIRQDIADANQEITDTRAEQAQNRAEAEQAIADAREGAQERLGALSSEEVGLRVTAAQNIDPAKREAAEKRLAEIAQERQQIQADLARQISDIQTEAQRKALAYEAEVTKLQQERAKSEQALQDEQLRNIYRTYVAQAAQADLTNAAAQAQELAKVDPKSADEYYDRRRREILRLADLEQQMIEAETPAQKAAIQAQIDAEKQAQAVEQQIWERDFEKRKQELADLAAIGQGEGIDTSITNGVMQGLQPFLSSLDSLTATLAALAGIPALASGTMSAMRGPAWVGENGPELVEFQGGERVYSNRESRQMAMPTQYIGGARSYSSSTNVYVDARGASGSDAAAIQRAVAAGIASVGAMADVRMRMA